jgi:hypothetical protein
MPAEDKEQADAEALVLETSVNAAIAACDGNLRATVRALVVANNFLTEHNQALSAELDYAWKWISPGYTRSATRRRMKTGEPD